MAEKKEEASKKSKEELRWEKELNRSMKPIPGKNNGLLGIQAYEPEKKVFQMMGGGFIKVYGLRGVELTASRKEALADTILEHINKKVRITSFLYPNSPAALSFLTVYFDGNVYSEVYEEIEKMNTVIQTMMKTSFKLSFVPCDIGDVCMFLYMNYFGQMKKISWESIEKRSINLRKDYYGAVKEEENGFFIGDTGRSGINLICMQYPEHYRVGFFEELKKLGFGYMSLVEFQILSQGNELAYEKILMDKYNTPVLEKVTDRINATFMISMIFPSEEQKEENTPKVKDILADYGFVMGPSTGFSDKVFESISSIGIERFHSMRNIPMGWLPMFIG